ncbi:MAG: SurA N-terminal domain-containing protein [Elusimicrobiota bacterium]
MFFKILTAVLATAFFSYSQPAAQQLPMMPEAQAEDKVVATVEGEDLYMSQLQELAQTQQLVFQMMNINPQFAQFLQSREGEQALEEYEKFVLGNLISHTLLKQEAEKEGIEITEQEKQEHFENHIQQLKEQHQLSQDDLEDLIQQQEISSMDEYRELFLEHSNLKEHKLLEKEGIDDSNIEEYITGLKEKADIEIHL